MDQSIARSTRRRWPVRLIMVGIVFALVLPGVLFCGVLLNQIATGERARLQEAAQAAAVRAAESIDRELANISAALLAVSTSPALDEGNLAVFYRQASTVAQLMGQGIVLGDVAGQQLVNTRRPFGVALPMMQARETFQQVLRTRSPAISDLFQGGVTGARSVVVEVPVMRGGEVSAVLAMSLQPDHLSGLLQRQGLPAGWVASVLDGGDRVIGRSADGPRFIGQKATREQVVQMQTSSETWIGTTLDGIPVLAATQPLHLAQWRVGVGVPLTVIEAPLRSTLMLLAITGTATMALACLLAWKLANSVARPLQRLGQAGGALGAGLPVLGVSSAIAEVDAVSSALVQATQDLRARADALAAERAQLAAVIQTVPVGLLITELPSGRIVDGNQQLETMLRHPLRHSSGTAEYGEWVAHHADGRVVQAGEYPLAQIAEGAVFAELQCIYQRGDGTPLWIQIVAAPICGADGAVTGAVAAVLDIDEVVRAREEKSRFAESLEAQVVERTSALEAANQRLVDEGLARTAAEEQLRQVQKMEAVGQLTGGIAHDFNNLLTIVIGSLDLLRRRAEDARTKRLLDNALEGAARAATLTARLLAFSRRQPLQPQAVDVNKLVAGMSDLLHRTLGDGVQVETVLAGGVWQTHADPNQLENALLNLAVNGRDAIVTAGRPGGRLVIGTANATLDGAALVQDPDVTPGDFVQICVTDTGTGMPAEVAARVFEPFYTTKPQGQGTGLGLSQVHGFVKQSGGHVAITTVPGEGTTVSIYLPRSDAMEAVARVDEPALEVGSAGPSGLTVLVTEDDAGVRQYSVEALRDLGHTVLEADGGAAALRLLDAHPEIGLLLTDVLLPGMDGIHLAAEARRRRPALPVLFASGFTGNEEGRLGQLPKEEWLLQKPFTVHGLAAKLGEVLEAAG